MSPPAPPAPAPVLVPIPAPGQVDLWVCSGTRNSGEVDDALLARWREWMTPEECAREVRFHFERDREQFVTTRALVRSVLGGYLGRAPEALRFTPGSHGRPHLVWPEPVPLSFNLSHTRGMVLLAVSRPHPLGVDVENWRERAAPLDVAGHYFSDPEARALYALPAEQQEERFFQYWTLKEAFIKARELGLSLPLRRFGLEFCDPDALTPWFDPTIETDPRHWQFALLHAGNDHVVSICIRASARLSVRAQQVLPLQYEQAMLLPLLRQTVKP